MLAVLVLAIHTLVLRTTPDRFRAGNRCGVSPQPHGASLCHAQHRDAATGPGSSATSPAGRQACSQETGQARQALPKGTRGSSP
ncbi:hypothetical protein LP415_02480 [Polaromonas sp. P1(28)-8]|nr:hypothetical protein LP415_02480 [Polaromonas sp. P1(28)-8]